MFVYLSKKIAIPNGLKLECLSWNSSEGWISCGGANGLLKVLKMEAQQSQDPRARGVAAPSNLSMNQTLEGHNGAVKVCTWNPGFRKLTTSDENGLIIVWMLHRGMWFEEMINNRNKSTVSDMRWTPNGQKICIAYEDGAVVVGSVNGNRIWGKDLNLRLKFVEWSPDSRYILFGTADGQVYLYDSNGNRMSIIALHAVESNSSDAQDMIAMQWYDGSQGYVLPGCPAFAIAFANGRVQISRSRDDPDPVLIDTGMKLTQCRWNPNGSVLALAGVHQIDTPSGESKFVSMVQFYTPFGQHLRDLKVPGAGISALTWEGSGLRVALAVDAFIYFANIRPDYHWAFFEKSLAYGFTRPERQEHCVVFWDTKTDERYTKHISRLLGIRAAGENCVVVSEVLPSTSESSINSDALIQGGGSSSPSNSKNESKSSAAGGGRGEGGGGGSSKDRSNTSGKTQYKMVLCDAIGSLIDTKHTTVYPTYLTMTTQHVIVASESAVYLWQYRTLAAKLIQSNTASGSSPSAHATALAAVGANPASTAAAQALRRKEGRDRVFHIDSMMNVGDDVSSSSKQRRSSGGQKLSVKQSSDDPIACIAANTKFLIVGRVSGAIHRYTLPHIHLENKYVVPFRPQMISINCDSSRLGVIDIHGVLTFFDMESRVAQDGFTKLGEQIAFDRKDTWDMLWAEDNPELFGLMEKTRLVVMQGLNAQDPLLSSGYLCEHKDLQVKAILLDEVFKNPNNPDYECIVDFETKSLRDAREILNSGGVDEAHAYIQEHPHPRLWRLLAEAALERLQFSVAEKAFVQCADYPGIHFVKRLGVLNDRVKQRAEVAAYFQRFDEAEALYREIDRKDLAIELRTRLGDWFRVVQLVQTGGGDDQILSVAWNNIGDYYVDRQKWSKAVQYYVSSKNAKALVECYTVLEEYDSLEKLVRVIPDGSQLLVDVGKKFQAVGLCCAACDAFIKSGDVKAAIDCCVMLNQWDEAVRLAQENQFPQIEGLLAKYASHLLDKGNTLQAIKLYRKAKKSTQAATLLARLAQDVNRTRTDPLRAKKLHVLAAMEVEEMRMRTLDQQLKSMGGGSTRANQTVAQTTAATLESLMQDDAATGEHRALDNGWKGAEAYHFLMLAQRQLYSRNTTDAFVTSLKLVEYEDVLNPRDIYALIALTSFFNQAWGQCSKAFIELESLGNTRVDTFGGGGTKKKSQTSASPQDSNDDVDGSTSTEAGGGYVDLAFEIFGKHAPTDPPKVAKIASRCGKGVATCVASGRPLLDGNNSSRIYKCRRCSRKMYEQFLANKNHCPLCHHVLI